MPYNIEFQLAGLVMTILFTVVFFSKSRMKNIQNHIYGIELIETLVILVLDIASVITIHYHEAAGGWTDFFSKSYLCVVTVWITGIWLYTLSLTRIWDILNAHRRLKKAFFTLVVMVVGIVWLFIILEELNYYSDGRDIYSYGVATNILYGFAAISLLCCYTVTIIDSRRIPFIRRLSIYVYIAIVTTVSMIQIMCPTVLLVSAGGALTLVFMYFTLENPDMELIAELNQARWEADRANQAKADFLARMSHEIRTPIHAVIGMNEMILQKNRNEEIQGYAEYIERAGKNLLAIVNDILDISKIESGKMDLVSVEYETGEMIQELSSVAGLSAQEKNLDFLVEVEGEFPRTLYGDEVRIKQIIMNLLSNAVKYTQRGSVTLSFLGRTTGEKQMEMIVSVADTGQGIREEDKKRLFQSFERIEEERNHSIEGTGLGLSIICQLLEAMEGRIEVESSYGEGSKFTVYIPQEVVNEEAILSLMEEGVPQAKEHVSAPDKRVLLVDDNQTSLYVTSSLLERSRVQIETAGSGAECIEKMRRQSYSLVFIDYRMPEMNGEETAGVLRKEKLAGEAKLIVLSGDDLRECYAQKGFDDWLIKPIAMDQMEKLLQKYLT